MGQLTGRDQLTGEGHRIVPVQLTDVATITSRLFLLYLSWEHGRVYNVHWTPLHICFCLQIKTPLQGGTMLLTNEVCHQSGGWSCDPQWTELSGGGRLGSLTSRTLWLILRGFSTDSGLLGWDFDFCGAVYRPGATQRHPFCAQ